MLTDLETHKDAEETNEKYIKARINALQEYSTPYDLEEKKKFR